MATKTQDNTPPELRFLLEGEERYETREAIVAAFYDICQGDPTSYPVQYALVQKAHLRAMSRHAARTDEVLAAALQLAKVMQQETGKQERAAAALTQQMDAADKRVGEAVASEKRLAQIIDDSVGNLRTEGFRAVKDIENSSRNALMKFDKDAQAAMEHVKKIARSLDSKSLFMAMVIGLLLGSIVAGLSFHVVTLNWPPR